MTTTIRIEDLREALPDLLNFFLWRINPWPRELTEDHDLLHIGCGGNVLDGFLNVDFTPEDQRVLDWNLLNGWPRLMHGKFRGAFCEDTLEHFFFTEQAYILCSMNMALRRTGIFRVLMPSVSRLVQVYQEYHGQQDGYLMRTFGATTAADILNAGLRGSGHRWLHDKVSMAALAEMCGFQAIPTPCNESVMAEFSRLNRRDESQTLSFATDLKKTEILQYYRLLPNDVRNADVLEEIEPAQKICRARNSDPQIVYDLDVPIQAGKVRVINAVSANMSQFYEHNFSRLYVATEANGGYNEKDAFNFDSTLRSSPCVNMIAQNRLKMTLQGEDVITGLRFDPGKDAGDVFTAGPLEIFTLI